MVFGRYIGVREGWQFSPISCWYTFTGQTAIASPSLCTLSGPICNRKNWPRTDRRLLLVSTSWNYRKFGTHIGRNTFKTWIIWAEWWKTGLSYSRYSQTGNVRVKLWSTLSWRVKLYPKRKPVWCLPTVWGLLNFIMSAQLDDVGLTIRCLPLYLNVV